MQFSNVVLVPLFIYQYNVVKFYLINILMSVCLKNLKNGISKMLPNPTSSPVSLLLLFPP